jgi:hypothetical protein
MARQIRLKKFDNEGAHPHAQMNRAYVAMLLISSLENLI